MADEKPREPQAIEKVIYRFPPHLKEAIDNLGTVFTSPVRNRETYQTENHPLSWSFLIVDAHLSGDVQTQWKVNQCVATADH